MTPAETVVAHRWDGREDDRDVYDLIFDQAMDMIKAEEREVGSLLLQIINSWEKNRRNVAMPVIAAAYAVAVEWQRAREMDAGLKNLLDEAEQ